MKGLRAFEGLNCQSKFCSLRGKILAILAQSIPKSKRFTKDEILLKSIIHSCSRLAQSRFNKICDNSETSLIDASQGDEMADASD